MKFVLVILTACFCVGLLGCAGGACPTLPDIRLQPPVLFERAPATVPGPRLQPQTYYAQPTYQPMYIPPTYTAPRGPCQ